MALEASVHQAGVSWGPVEEPSCSPAWHTILAGARPSARVRGTSGLLPKPRGIVTEVLIVSGSGCGCYGIPIAGRYHTRARPNIHHDGLRSLATWGHRHIRPRDSPHPRRWAGPVQDAARTLLVPLELKWLILACVSNELRFHNTGSSMADYYRWD